MRKKLQTALAILKKNGLWIVFIFIALAGCIINIIYSYNIDNHTNFFTAISGWVSFLATFLIGVIAALQSKQYKEENDKYLEEQAILNKNFMQEQTDLAWRKSKYDTLSTYLKGLEERRFRFGQDCNIHNIISEMNFGFDEKAKVLMAFNNSMDKFSYTFVELLLYAEHPIQYFEWHEEFYIALKNFHAKGWHVLNKLNAMAAPTANPAIIVEQELSAIQECNECFENVQRALSVYIICLSEKISEIYDADIGNLRNYYNDLREQYKEWRLQLSKNEGDIGDKKDD